MPLLVWFSIENNSLLLALQKPQVPATVRGIKRKLSGALFCKPLAINKFWWGLHYLNRCADLRQEKVAELFFVLGCQNSQQKTSLAEHLALTSNA